MDGGQSCENALNLNGNKFFKEGQFLFSETLEAFVRRKFTLHRWASRHFPKVNYWLWLRLISVIEISPKIRFFHHFLPLDFGHRYDFMLQAALR